MGLGAGEFRSIPLSGIRSRDSLGNWRRRNVDYYLARQDRRGFVSCRGWQQFRLARLEPAGSSHLRPGRRDGFMRERSGSAGGRGRLSGPRLLSRRQKGPGYHRTGAGAGPPIFSCPASKRAGPPARRWPGAGPTRL